MTLHCEEPATLNHAENFASGQSFHHVITIASAILTFLTCCLTLGLASFHSRCYVCPPQQKLILRIIILPAVYSLCSLFGIIFYGAEPYIDPINKIFEAIAICGLFELYVDYVAPGTAAQRDSFFLALDRHGLFKKRKEGRGSLRWFRVIWLCVYQFMFTTMVLFTATEVFAAFQCPLSSKARATMLIIHLVSFAVTVIAVAAIILFYHRMRTELRPLKALSKLISLKLLVIVVIIQDVVFSIINKARLPVPTPHLSYWDLKKGVPNVLTSCEMVLFALLFFITFSATPYRHALVKSGQDPTGNSLRRGSMLSAFLDAFNITDVFKGVWVAATILVKLPFGQKRLNRVTGSKQEVHHEGLSSDLEEKSVQVPPTTSQY